MKRKYKKTVNNSRMIADIKYQLTKTLNVETLYTNFVRGNNTGLGQTFNIGLRALF